MLYNLSHSWNGNEVIITYYIKNRHSIRLYDFSAIIFVYHVSNTGTNDKKKNCILSPCGLLVPG